MMLQSFLRANGLIGNLNTGLYSIQNCLGAQSQIKLPSSVQHGLPSGDDFKIVKDVAAVDNEIDPPGEKIFDGVDEENAARMAQEEAVRRAEKEIQRQRLICYATRAAFAALTASFAVFYHYDLIPSLDFWNSDSYKPENVFDHAICPADFDVCPAANSTVNSFQNNLSTLNPISYNDPEVCLPLNLTKPSLVVADTLPEAFHVIHEPQGDLLPAPIAKQYPFPDYRNRTHQEMTPIPANWSNASQSIYLPSVTSSQEREVKIMPSVERVISSVEEAAQMTDGNLLSKCGLVITLAAVVSYLYKCAFVETQPDSSGDMSAGVMSNADHSRYPYNNSSQTESVSDSSSSSDSLSPPHTKDRIQPAAPQAQDQAPLNQQPKPKQLPVGRNRQDRLLRNGDSQITPLYSKRDDSESQPTLISSVLNNNRDKNPPKPKEPPVGKSDATLVAAKKDENSRPSQVPLPIKGNQSKRTSVPITAKVNSLPPDSIKRKNGALCTPFNSKANPHVKKVPNRFEPAPKQSPWVKRAPAAIEVHPNSNEFPALTKTSKLPKPFVNPSQQEHFISPNWTISPIAHKRNEETPMPFQEKKEHLWRFRENTEENSADVQWKTPDPNGSYGEPMTKGRFIKNRIKLVEELLAESGNVTFLADYIEKLEVMAEDYDTTTISGYSRTRASRPGAQVDSSSMFSKIFPRISKPLQASTIASPKGASQPSTQSPLKLIAQKCRDPEFSMVKFKESYAAVEHHAPKLKQSIEIKTELLLLIDMLDISPYSEMLNEFCYEMIGEFLENFESKIQDPQSFKLVPSCEKGELTPISLSGSDPSPIAISPKSNPFKRDHNIVSPIDSPMEMSSFDSSEISGSELKDIKVTTTQFVKMIKDLIVSLEVNHEKMIEFKEDKEIVNALIGEVLTIFNPSLVIIRDN